MSARNACPLRQNGRALESDEARRNYGTDSSSSSFIAARYQYRRRPFQNGDGLVPRHGRVVHQEIVESIARFEVLHQDPHRGAGSGPCPERAGDGAGRPAGRSARARRPSRRKAALLLPPGRHGIDALWRSGHRELNRACVLGSVLVQARGGIGDRLGEKAAYSTNALI